MTSEETPIRVERSQGPCFFNMACTRFKRNTKFAYCVTFMWYTVVALSLVYLYGITFAKKEKPQTPLPLGARRRVILKPAVEQPVVVQPVPVDGQPPNFNVDNELNLEAQDPNAPPQPGDGLVGDNYTQGAAISTDIPPVVQPAGEVAAAAAEAAAGVNPTLIQNNGVQPGGWDSNFQTQGNWPGNPGAMNINGPGVGQNNGPPPQPQAPPLNEMAPNAGADAFGNPNPNGQFVNPAGVAGAMQPLAGFNNVPPGAEVPFAGQQWARPGENTNQLIGVGVGGGQPAVQMGDGFNQPPAYPPPANQVGAGAFQMNQMGPGAPAPFNQPVNQMGEGGVPPFHQMGGGVPPVNPIGEGGVSPVNQMGGGVPPANPMGEGGGPPVNQMGGGVPPVNPMGGGVPPAYQLVGGVPVANPMAGGAPVPNPMAGGAPGPNQLAGSAPVPNPMAGGAPVPNPMAGGAPGPNQLAGGAPVPNPMERGAQVANPMAAIPGAAVVPEQLVAVPEPLGDKAAEPVGDAAFEEWKRVQQERREQVQRACIRQRHQPYAGTTFESLTRHMLVETKHQVVYCRLPKVASTSWCLAMAALQSGLTIPEVMADKAKNNYRLHYAPHLATYGIKDLTECTSLELRTILKTYPKFLIVRHPFQRLVSAYKDKFVSPYPQEQIFIDINRYIIKNYRQQGSQTTGNATFIEFLNYSLEDRQNTHWALATDLCHPCDVQFDYIGKLETFSQDTKYLLKLLLKVDDENFLHLANPTSPQNAHAETYQYTYPTYFKAVPQTLVAALYEAYRVDFETFGYNLE